MTINEAMEGLLSLLPDDYDKSAGAFFYDLIYPVAVCIKNFSDRLDSFSEKAFAKTAEGDFLDAKVAEQNITRKSAGYASGTVRIYGNRGEIVLAGTKVAADNVLFSVDERAVITQAGYVDVTATCILPGNVGNVQVGEINRFPVTLPNLISVTNTTAFSGGYDAESDEDLRQRYFDKVSRPVSSGNVYHYIEWAKSVDGVGNVSVFPLWNGAGTVKVVITDRENQPANDGLISAVTECIENNRPIGANVTVVSADALNVDVSVTLKAVNDDSVENDIKNAISSYLSNTALDNGYISYARIGSIILAVEGVVDYSELTINGGSENISIGETEVPVLGSAVISYD